VNRRYCIGLPLGAGTLSKAMKTASYDSNSMDSEGGGLRLDCTISLFIYLYKSQNCAQGITY